MLEVSFYLKDCCFSLFHHHGAAPSLAMSYARPVDSIYSLYVPFGSTYPPCTRGFCTGFGFDMPTTSPCAQTSALPLHHRRAPCSSPQRSAIIYLQLNTRLLSSPSPSPHRPSQVSTPSKTPRALSRRHTAETIIEYDGHRRFGVPGLYFKNTLTHKIPESSHHRLIFRQYFPSLSNIRT